MENLSENATKLYEYLKKTGGSWAQDCMECLFPKPDYTKDPVAYWQYDCNMYGGDYKRPVNGISIEFKATADYSRIVSAAYKELRLAGLANEKK